MKQSISYHKIDYKTGRVKATDIQVDVEMPLTLYVNDRQVQTLLCLPEHLDLLIIGYLYNTYDITSVEEIKSMVIDEDKGLAYIDLYKDHIPDHQRYITSGCSSSAAYYSLEDAVRLRFKKLIGPAISLEFLKKAIEHAKDGHVVLYDDSMIRYKGLTTNKALDKLMGHMIKHSILPSQKILAIEGVVSSEMILKAIRIGLSAIVSKKPPTSKAIKLARMHQILLVSFNDDSVNVFSEYSRVLI